MPQREPCRSPLATALTRPFAPLPSNASALPEAPLNTFPVKEETPAPPEA